MIDEARIHWLKDLRQRNSTPAQSGPASERDARMPMMCEEKEDQSSSRMGKIVPETDKAPTSRAATNDGVARRKKTEAGEDYTEPENQCD